MMSSRKRIETKKEAEAKALHSINLVMSEWMSNTDTLMTDVASRHGGTMVRTTPFWCISNDLELGEVIEGDITLVTQFFVGRTPVRANELRSALKVNVMNPFINKIVLLNERVYSDDELGVKSDKIQQVVVGNRLDYKTAFDNVESLGLKGYIVLSNLDIFFDKSIEKLKQSGIADEKAMFCLLRYEYKPGRPVSEAPLSHHLSDSQDTWIWHSNHNAPSHHRKILDFELGVPGCDNTMAYLANVLGYKVYNTPNIIKSYHNHSSNQRSYNINTPRTPQPYYSVRAIVDSGPMRDYKQDPKHPFTFHGENDNFRNYLETKLAENVPFVVPRLAGVEHNYAIIGAHAAQRGRFIDQEADYLNKTRAVMKNNAGIFLPDASSVIDYATAYLRPFDKCDMFFDWEPQGDVAAGGLQTAFEFLYMNFVRRRLWAFGVLDLFHVVNQKKPWTHTLAGKRILVISPFADTFQKQVPHLPKIYGRDMFPGCTFTFLKPPVTNAKNKSRSFMEELNNFTSRVEAVKDSFDVALVSCGGYGNPILGRLYEMGKSAIYVGGVLQMYFGVYGSRWERERPLVMKLFKNEHWVRPSNDERPPGFENVEESCYW